MNLKEELRTEQVNHLDLAGFCLVGSGTSVRATLAQMRAEGHNVCLVTVSDKLVGILTDRDVLRKIASSPDIWDRPVDEVMTPDPVTVNPASSAADALWLMDQKHFRNLPVVDAQGKIVGNMTHQAVIDYLAARFPIEVLNRAPDPERFPRKAEGG